MKIPHRKESRYLATGNFSFQNWVVIADYQVSQVFTMYMLFSHTRTLSFDGKLVTLINIALTSIIFEVWNSANSLLGDVFAAVAVVVAFLKVFRYSFFTDILEVISHILLLGNFGSFFLVILKTNLSVLSTPFLMQLYSKLWLLALFCCISLERLNRILFKPHHRTSRFI